MNTEGKLLGALAISFLYLAGCSSKPDQVTAAVLPTETPTSSPTPTPTPTETPLSTPTPTETPTPTLTPTPTPFPLDEGKLTNYLAGFNQLADERTGESITSKEVFKAYFREREVLVDNNQPIVKFDRMFAQLFLPVKNFRDRSLNFDWNNSGQGLGFSNEDFSVLRTLDDLSSMQGEFFRKGEDNYQRSWLLTEAHNADAAVLAQVDNWLELNGKDPQGDSVQALRKQTFRRIIFGDLGVIEVGVAEDDNWETVNDLFDISCSTYTETAGQRSKQPEASRRLSFKPEQEDKTTSKEDEGKTNLDSDDYVLVVSVVSPDNKILRVEVYTLSNTPDELNQVQDQAEAVDVSAAGYRWLPCGVGGPKPTSTPGKTEQTPEKTPTPPYTPTPYHTPTPVPTNTDIIPTATSGEPPTVDPTATNIP